MKYYLIFGENFFFFNFDKTYVHILLILFKKNYIFKKIIGKLRIFYFIFIIYIKKIFYI